MTCTAAAVSPFASASEQALSIRERVASSVELTELYLERIRRYNPSLQAIVVSNETDALQTARQRDANLLPGSLHGVPVTVKEAFNLSGHKTTVNFPALKNNIAADDSYVVQRLKQAGAVLLGKTNVPIMLADYQSFGSLYPTANNPFDTARTPGGSTGGGAAAVSAGLTALEIGSDLAGSIRVPAHFCGVFGLKPTENAAMHGEGHVPPPPGSRAGFVAMACIGPLARTMADIELAWNVINPPSWDYSSHLPQKPRLKTSLNEYKIAWFDDVGAAACGSDTKRVLAAFLQTLQAHGVTQEKRPFSLHWLTEAYTVWGLLFGAIVGQHVPWLVGQVMKRQFAGGNAIDIRTAWKAGLSLHFPTFTRALTRRKDLIRDLQQRFTEYDFLVSPVAAGPAFHHNKEHRPIELDGHTLPYIDYAMPYNIAYNVCGNPSLVIPAGRASNGLPIGLQIAAPHYAEPELIHFGKLLEQLGFVCPTPASYQ